jgi:hypothetical protein
MSNFRKLFEEEVFLNTVLIENLTDAENKIAVKFIGLGILFKLETLVTVLELA